MSEQAIDVQDIIGGAKDYLAVTASEEFNKVSINYAESTGNFRINLRIEDTKENRRHYDNQIQSLISIWQAAIVRPKRFWEGDVFTPKAELLSKKQVQARELDGKYLHIVVPVFKVDEDGNIINLEEAEPRVQNTVLNDVTYGEAREVLQRRLG